jgi:hypothetical protein
MLEEWKSAGCHTEPALCGSLLCYSVTLAETEVGEDKERYGDSRTMVR